VAGLLLANVQRCNKNVLAKLTTPETTDVFPKLISVRLRCRWRKRWPGRTFHIVGGAERGNPLRQLLENVRIPNAIAFTVLG
jgi:hypothetical protein